MVASVQLSRLQRGALLQLRNRYLAAAGASAQRRQRLTTLLQVLGP